MIDYFALALTHALIAIAMLRMLGRDELDHEERKTGPSPAPSESTPRAKRRERRARNAPDDA